MSPDGNCVRCRKPLKDRAAWCASYCSRLCSQLAAAEARKPMMPADPVLLAAAEAFGVTVPDLRGRSRVELVSKARQVAALLLWHAGYSYPAMARELGNRDHATMIYAVRRAQAFYAERAREIAPRLGIEIAGAAA